MFNNIGAPCRFSGRFEDGSFSLKTKMKTCSNLNWRMKMWRTQISSLLKNEDYRLPHLLKMKIAFLKLLKTGELKTPLENVKKINKTMSGAGSPNNHCGRMFDGLIGSFGAPSKTCKKLEFSSYWKSLLALRSVVWWLLYRATSYF